jgi:hypothetical protein
MWRVLSKLFGPNVLPCQCRLFPVFLFCLFGAVEGGQLVGYHLSLIKSILDQHRTRFDSFAGYFITLNAQLRSYA